MRVLRPQEGRTRKIWLQSAPCLLHQRDKLTLDFISFCRLILRSPLSILHYRFAILDQPRSNQIQPGRARSARIGPNLTPELPLAGNVPSRPERHLSTAAGAAHLETTFRSISLSTCHLCHSPELVLMASLELGILSIFRVLVNNQIAIDGISAIIFLRIRHHPASSSIS